MSLLSLTYLPYWVVGVMSWGGDGTWCLVNPANHASRQHSWANRTNEWVRVLCVVLASDPVKVDGKELGELWLN